MSELYGDFKGLGSYKENLLAAEGLRLERENSDGSVTSGVGKGINSNRNVMEERSQGCSVLTFPHVFDDIANPTVEESWKFTLCDGARTVRFESSGTVLSAQASLQMRTVRHALYARSLSTTGFFDQGVVQIMSAEPKYSHFASSDRLHHAYVLGGVGAIDILRPGATGGEQDQVVLLNGVPDAEGAKYTSGFHEILVGNFSHRDYWVAGSSASDAQTIAQTGATTWTREWQISPNNRNFPSAQLPSGGVSNMDNSDDLESLMTGIYGSAVPCLCTYPNEVTNGFQVAQIATTLRNGKGRGYNHTYNYFDPDNFIGLSAVLYSGDPYLQNQARMVIERTGSFIKPENGQLPHHFVGVKPFYVALSGETQTGPNVFWVKTALRYAAVTGDVAWLQSYMPTLRNASSFVFDLIDPQMNLIFAPGSLMIDVFIRNNYTTDSNAMVVGLLRDFAGAERLLGNTDRAAELEGTAERVTAAINKYLWAGDAAGADHYITQLNLDGTTRDFVDYDANLIAVAHSVSDTERSRLIQKRVDAGQCSAANGAGPQFVSEVYYGPNDTTSGNIGDSWCSMGRIGLFDALGRKRFGEQQDLEYFNEKVLAPVQRDVIAFTWMHERYGCDGLQQENRTMYYFEYPSLAAMLVREIKYGVELTLDAIAVNPFGAPAVFQYHTGDVHVSIDPAAVSSLTVPGSGLFAYALQTMVPSASYKVEVAQGCSTSWASVQVQADSEGKLTFSAPRGTDCTLSVKKV